MDAPTLAERSGLGLSTVHAYLSGRQRGLQPRPGTIEALAEALGADPAVLYRAAEREDVGGASRLLRYFRMIPTAKGRAEAIEAVRQVMMRHRHNV